MMIKAKEADATPLHGPWELPQGWKWLPLAGLCSDIVGGGTPLRSRSEYFGGGIVWVTPSDLDTNDPCQEVMTSQFTLTPLGLHSSSAKLIPAGTVLFSSRATIGKIAIAGVPLCTNQGFVNFVCKDAQLNNHYLAWCLRLLTEEIKKLANPTTYFEVSRGNLRSFKIPIPFPNNHIRSLDIQHRIVSRIEALLAELKEAQESLNGMRRDIDEVMESVLREVFEDSPRVPTVWDEKHVSELCYHPQYGYTQSATFEPVGPKFLRITDIQNGDVNWDTVPYCQISPERLLTYQLQKGDILFARSGATTGKTFLVRECPTAVFASYLIRLRVRERILPELLGWFFRSEIYWKQVRPRGGAQPNMNARLLGNVKVRYPTSSQAQQQVVNYLNSVQDEVNEMQKILEEDDELLQEVEQGILYQAFRGGL